MNYFSCFDGISAASVAWQPLGFQNIGLSEIDPFCCKLLNQKYGHKNYGNFFQWREWGNIKADIIIASPPCTAFSNLGLRRGTNDPAGQLSVETIRFIHRNTPRWFVIENVPQMLLADGTKLWKFMCSTLSRRGYSLSWQVLDAQYFGVAQRRRRMFVIGHLGSSTGAPKVLFDPDTLPCCVTPSREKGEGNPTTFTEYNRKNSARSNHTDQHRIRYKDNPTISGTIATQIDSGSEQINRLIIDGDKVRYLTPLECERLQGLNCATLVNKKCKYLIVAITGFQYRRWSSWISSELSELVGKRLLANTVHNSSIYYKYQFQLRP
jgi:DNA (cytosine-5)-methyltransferase 1